MLLWPLRDLSCVFLVPGCLTNLNTITIFTVDLVHDSSGSLFLDLLFGLLKYARDGADIDVETSNKFCDSRKIGLGYPVKISNSILNQLGSQIER